VTPELLATLQSALGENNSHAEKIRRAVQILAPLVPFSVETFSGLGDETIMVVDQLIYRFTKMQDSLGTRFLPAVYALLEDDDRPRPFLDILNRLEQLRVVEDVATWQFFRELRNRLAHDYPESVQQTIETLNLLHSGIERFLKLYEVAKAACVSRL